MKCEACEAHTHQILSLQTGYTIHQCKVCSLTFALPKPSNKELENFYNGFTYAQNRKLSEYVPIANTVIKKIKKYKPKTNKVLDFGGGTGMISACLAKEFKVTLFDRDKEALKHAKNSFPKQFIVTNKLPQEEFDFVFANQVIEHYAQIEEFMFQVNTVTKKGSLIIITTPNQKSREHLFRPVLAFSLLRNVRIKNFLKAIYKLVTNPYFSCDPPRHIYAFNKKNLEILFSKHGYTKIDSFTEYSHRATLSYKKHRLKKIQSVKDILGNIYCLITQCALNICSILDTSKKYGSNVTIIIQKE